MLLTWRDLAPGDGPEINTSITEREADKLRELAANKNALEVGSAYGFSAVVMGLAGAHVTAVDPHTWLSSYNTFIAHVRAYNVGKHVQVVPATSFVALPMMMNRGDRFDFIFVDGDHAEASVEFDVTWARKLLTPGGVLACHDWDEDTCPGVRPALERVLGPPDELIDTLAVYTGLA